MNVTVMTLGEAEQQGIVVDGCLVKAPTLSKNGEMVVPSGVRVIAKEAFESAGYTLRSLVLPASVDSIEFPWRISLEAISAYDDAGQIKSPEEGTYDLRNVKLATGLHRMEFLEKGMLLLGGETVLGEDLFPSVMVVVDEANPRYSSKNGCAYSKDYSTLLRCPSTAQRGGDSADPFDTPSPVRKIARGALVGGGVSLVVPDSVVEIDEEAFGGSDVLGGFYGNALIRHRISLPGEVGERALGGAKDPETLYVVRRSSGEYSHVVINSLAPKGNMRAISWSDKAYAGDYEAIGKCLDKAFLSEKLKDLPSKARIAIVRLAAGVSPEARAGKAYLEYLQKNKAKIVKTLTESEEWPLIDLLPLTGVEFGGVEPSRSKSKPTPKMGMEEIIESLERGEDAAESIRALKVKPDSTNPVTVVKMLEAAAHSSGENVDAIYDVFKAVEFTGNALSTALLAGNVSAARAMVSHGAVLGDYGLSKISYKGDTASKRDKRRDQYTKDRVVPIVQRKSKEAKKEVAAAEDNAKAIISLVEDGTFDAEDTKWLMLHALALKNLQLAEALLPSYSDLPKVSVWHNYAKNSSRQYERMADLLYPNADGKVIRFVLANIPESEVNETWEKHGSWSSDRYGESSESLLYGDKFLGSKDAESTLEIIRRLDCSKASNRAGIMAFLVVHGFIEDLARELESGALKRGDIEGLIGVAMEAGKSEVVAWLLEVKERGFGGSASDDLRL